MLVEVPAQGSGDQGQHHVVDLDAVRLLERLDVGHGHRRERQLPAGADGGVERSDRSPQDGPVLLVVADAVDGGHALAGQRVGVAGHVQRSARLLEEDPPQDLPVARLRAGLALLGGGQGGQRGGGIRLEVEQHGGQAGPGHPVEEAVVVFEEDPDLAPRQSLYEPDLPEGLAPVQLRAHEGADDLADLLGPAGRRHADAADVAADVELLVVHPQWPVQAEGGLLELPLELRGVGQPFVDLDDEVVEGDGAVLGVDDAQPPDVLVPVRRLERQEQSVGATESLHE